MLEVLILLQGCAKKQPLR